MVNFGGDRVLPVITPTAGNLPVQGTLDQIRMMGVAGGGFDAGGSAVAQTLDYISILGRSQGPLGPSGIDGVLDAIRMLGIAGGSITQGNTIGGAVAANVALNQIANLGQGNGLNVVG